MSVDAPGKELRPRLLVRRHGFPGDRRLVHVADPVHDDAVERHFVAGTHADDLTNRNVVHAHAHVTGRSNNECFLRREVHERANRVTRTIHGACLEVLRQGEQEDDRPRFRPLTENASADDRNGHEYIDVEVPGTSGCPGFADWVDTGSDNARQIEHEDERERCGPVGQ